MIRSLKNDDNVDNHAAATHIFEIEGRRFLVDVHSGIFFEIDDLAADILNLYAQNKSTRETQEILSLRYDAREVSEGVKEMANLIAAGHLFSSDRLEGYEPDPGELVHALSLILAQDCNLRCHYCYAEKGTFGRKQRMLMATKTAEKAVDFLFQHCGGIKTLSITFFGGEPLLNFDVLRDTVGYSKRMAEIHNKEIVFSLTTNGTLLSKSVSDFLVENGIGVMISLDGSKAIHDRNRPFPDGSGSYDIVSQNLMELLKTSSLEKVTVRGTLTRAYPDLAGVVKHLSGLGVKDISIEPCFTANGNLGFNKEDIDMLLKQYSGFAKEYVRATETGENMYLSQLETMIEQTQRANPRVIPCSAGVGYIAVSADGGLYPCHRLISAESYRFGDINNGINRPDIPHMFKTAHVLHKEKCSSCWSRYICGGGCRAFAINFCGNINEPFGPDCELTQHLIKLGVYVHAELKDRRRTFIKNKLRLVSKQRCSP